MVTVDRGSDGPGWFRKAWPKLVGRSAAYTLSLLAVLAGAATFAAFAGWLPLGRRGVLGLLILDLVVVGALAVMVGVRIARVMVGRRRGVIGSRLHLRFVLLFSLLAVAPTLLVAASSAIYLFFNIQEILTNPFLKSLEQVRTIVGPVAQSEAVRRDIAEIADALQQAGPEFADTSERVRPLLRTLAGGRNVVEAVVFTDDGRIVAFVRALGMPPGDPVLPGSDLLRSAATAGAPVYAPRSGLLYSVLQLFSGGKLFLMIGHNVNPDFWILDGQIAEAQRFYADLERNAVGIQLRTMAVYAIIALLLLLAAVGLALNFATRLTQPIADLIGAAERVRIGDLSARVPERRSDDELGVLTRSFNRMTGQLSEQRRELVEANRELEQRRELTEAVLAGVSAGVLSLDPSGMVERANRSATELLGRKDLEGRAVSEVMPEVVDLVESARLRPERAAQREVDVARPGGGRTLLIRVATRHRGDVQSGFVVTFDDVSDLLSAQRMAAWADVARRIAHEIKNPLTPIQLSAERLKRRFSRQIVDDVATFNLCTDTIIRQVGDIGRMVDEFSSFARMPRPTLQNEDIKELCQQALFLQRTASPQIRYEALLPPSTTIVSCDRRQVAQALTNLLKNAAEAIEGRSDGTERSPSGHIRLTLCEHRDGADITIEDNGRGLPKEGRERLTEPYVTTRTKGTGLGLAIVKKIMEDHGGVLRLEDGDLGGARVVLAFRKVAQDDKPISPAVSPSR